MALGFPNMDSYSDQLAAIQNQINNMKPPQVTAPAFQVSSPAYQIPSQVKYVDGIGGAKEYQSKMLPNSSEIIMDKNADVFYVVSKDANGVSPKSMPIGKFTIEQEELDEPVFMTRKDFEAFEDRIIKLLSESKES